jgi:hypothetical protein
VSTEVRDVAQVGATEDHHVVDVSVSFGIASTLPPATPGSEHHTETDCGKGKIVRHFAGRQPRLPVRAHRNDQPGVDRGRRAHLIGKEAKGIHFGTDRAITASATAEA